MMVTWPFALLLLDVWPLARIDTAACSIRAQSGRCCARSSRSSHLFIALSVGSAAITSSVGGRQHGFALAERLANAVVSYPRYLGKTIWPADLAILYLHPQAWPGLAVAASILLLIGLTLLALKVFRHKPYVLTGWLFFVGVLVPTIGLIQVGRQSIADRYTYVPLIGLFWISAWGTPELRQRWRRAGALLAIVAAVVLVAFGVTSRRYAAEWRSSDALFEHALAHTHDNWAVHAFHGENLLNAGQFERAPNAISESGRCVIEPPPHLRPGTGLAPRTVV
jgi:hypothetical protein